jgi:hypothetical protein
MIAALIIAAALVTALSFLCALDALAPWDDGGCLGVRDREGRHDR